MQTSYSNNFSQVAYPGQLADNGPTDVTTGLSLRAPAKTVTITAANSTAFTLHFAEAAGDEDATYTSDSTGTKAEIVAGLIAAIAANHDIKSWYGVNHGGDLVLVAKPGGPLALAVVTSTGAGTMTLAALSPEIPFGTVVAMDTASANASAGEEAVRLPNSATDVILGMALSTHFVESQGRFASDPTQAPQYPAGSPINVCRMGRVWAKPETAVVKGDPVYFRYASGGSGAGALTNTADVTGATGQVDTVTPTGVNSGDYALSLRISGKEYTYTYTADTSTSATEIADAFRTVINADSATHGIVGTGTATLILTGPDGVAFETEVGSNLANSSAAGVQKCALLAGARWLDTCSALGYARVQLNLA